MSVALEDLVAPAFPLRKGPRGYFDLARKARVIKDNVLQIVGTRRGERVRRPSFGISWERILFEPADEILFKLLRFEITEGLAKWEPRVTVLEIEPEIDATLGKLRYTVHYVINGLRLKDSASDERDLVRR